MSQAGESLAPDEQRRRAADNKQSVIDRIAEQGLALSNAADRALDLDAYFRNYFRNVAADDLTERVPADLAGAALAHLRFGRERKPGELKLRAYNPQQRSHGWQSTHTVIEMVNDDMPFIVDTLSMVANRTGMTVELTIHPVFRVRRDASGRLVEILPRDAAEGALESFVHMEVDRDTDTQRLDALLASIESSMKDVRAAGEDWLAMRDRVFAIAAELESHPPAPMPAETVTESIELLRWMAAHHFTFLGYREYRLVGTGEDRTLEPIVESGLGILRGAPVQKTRSQLLGRYIRRQVRSKDILIITKANSHSTVHRPGYLDYVGVKTFDESGEPIGERRFLGLFTSVAYSRSPREIPLLRHKVASVMERSGLAPASHAGKALLHILDTYPRDELFQISVDDLSRIAEGVRNLQERQRTRMFLRRDAFNRFISCLVYVPRDKYNTQIRRRIESILLAGLLGRSVESFVYLSESTLARLLIYVRTDTDTTAKVDVRDLEQQIVEVVRGWDDQLRDALIERYGEAEGIKLLNDYGRNFPAAYREEVSPRAATHDIERLAALGTARDALEMSLYRPGSFNASQLRFKLFRRGAPIPLSDALPLLENMGLRVITESPYRIELPDGQIAWIQDFEMQCAPLELPDPEEVRDIFQETFARAWRGEAENDRFNRLVLAARLDWRQAALLRAYCRYLLQTGLPFSQAYMEEVLNHNPQIVRLIVEEFVARFDPDLPAAGRPEAVAAQAAEVEQALDAVASADEDRILRAFLAVVRATLRTNYFQRSAGDAPKPYVSFKLDPTNIPDLPAPLPMFEIFVYSPRVEGVHLRSAKVARGGLRWSDRREDFRTEVLGLMKAQKVKNTVIVPTGAKGGFVPKRLPAGDRDEIQREGIACYQTFIRALLDVTDNIRDGKIAPPPRVVRVDEDDPYLVVAADKGTATFSDIANGIAREYDFWLGDAFASGGSAGYDHKKMAITARGGWEAVKRHFRELGVDVQSQEFTAVGIGDMAGDVFGNGMLQSRTMRLLGAFNHVHIFLDPSPDPERSYRERERLFNLPRSSWTDYDPAVLSKGGGVYSRRDKTITLSREARAMLGLTKDAATPNEVIRAILMMPADLLWNGGIGTYVKASHETNDRVGDRANDALRVNGRDLRCKVVGEGGNLGCTQLGRVEYALAGGRINTDFIDNSGGVDCSDHEVNIKILLSLADPATLPLPKRDKLLADMTEEVAGLVLRNNYLQTQAISIAESNAAERLREHAHLIRTLERDKELDRAIEFLPSDDQIEERAKMGRGLTRPELAVLLSYSKISLYSALVASDAQEDPFLANELARYFPEPLQKRYRDLMPRHPLAREIIATQITNSLVNRMGPTFVRRALEDTGATVGQLARAYAIAILAFEMRTLWTGVEALDNKVNANAQYSMMLQSARLIRHATSWLLATRSTSLDIAGAVEFFLPGIARLTKQLPKLLGPEGAKRHTETVDLYTDIGVPEKLAQRLAGLGPLYASLDIVTVARERGVDETQVGNVYFLLGDELGIQWLRDQIERLPVQGRWQAMARNSLRENVYRLQRNLSARILGGGGGSPAAIVRDWLTSNRGPVGRMQQILEEMRTTGALDFATLSVAVQELRQLTNQ
jgi:glutamate dehydrogenase